MNHLYGTYGVRQHHTGTISLAAQKLCRQQCCLPFL